MGNQMSTDPQVESLSSVLRAEIAKLGQGEREMEVVFGKHVEWDIHQHQKRCKKNPDHRDFIPVKNLSIDHLPIPWRCPRVLDMIKHKSNSAVRLVVRYTSPDRPSSLGFGNLKGKSVSRFGTGWFARKLPVGDPQPCPFENCKFSSVPHQVSPYFVIATAAHVVYNDSEARETTVEFFYDDEKDRSTVLKAEGVKMQGEFPEQDVCHILCVTHDLNWMPRMTRINNEFAAKPPIHLVTSSSPLAFIVSHPHGGSKQVTFGDLKHTEYLDIPSEKFMRKAEKEHYEETGSTTKFQSLVFCKFQYSVPTCPGSSGAPVFIFQMDGGKMKHSCAPHSCYHTFQQTNESGCGFFTHLYARA